MTDRTSEAIRVSLGMPVYNDVELVATAIASLQAQSFRDFELIVPTMLPPTAPRRCAAL